MVWVKYVCRNCWTIAINSHRSQHRHVQHRHGLFVTVLMHDIFLDDCALPHISECPVDYFHQFRVTFSTKLHFGCSLIIQHRHGRSTPSLQHHHVQHHHVNFHTVTM